MPVILLEVRAYSFISKDTRDAVSGVTLIVTDGIIFKDTLHSGIKLQEYSIKTDVPDKLLTKIGPVPGGFVLQ